MLTLVEKILFLALLALTAFLAGREFLHKRRLIMKGQAVNRFDHPLKPVWGMVLRVLPQTQVFGLRPLTGFFHAMIFWGFFVFALVTLAHVAEGLFAGVALWGHGLLYKLILAGANFFAGMILLSRAFPGSRSNHPLL